MAFLEGQSYSDEYLIAAESLGAACNSEGTELGSL
jgi:hypothetical protein